MNWPHIAQRKKAQMTDINVLPCIELSSSSNICQLIFFLQKLALMINNALMFQDYPFYSCCRCHDYQYRLTTDHAKTNANYQLHIGSGTILGTDDYRSRRGLKTKIIITSRFA